MGALFLGLQRALGSVLAFFFDINGGSFGLAIIMLTIAINFVLFPLTLRQTRATRAFQVIQPEIKRIQAEHKGDNQKMQAELMRVQKEAGATPGGCIVPLIVQMPIWFALFRVLRAIAVFSGGDASVDPLVPSGSSLYHALQLHNVNFLGMNLGGPMSEGVLGGMPGAIPYVVMLVLMVASQYFQQWHAQRGNNPTAAVDSKQKQQQQTQQVITKIMPLFIGFISWNFPAGLVVYWTTSNIFRLGQQYAIFAIDGRPPQPGSTDGAGPSGGPSKGGQDGDGNAAPKKPQPRAAKNRRRRR